MEVNLVFHTFGDSFTVTVERQWSIADVKIAVEKLRGVPYVEQKIVLGTEILSDETQVHELEQESGDEIQVFFVREGTEVLKWLCIAIQNWHKLQTDAPSWVWNDRRIVMAAMRQDPTVLKHAAPHIKEDKEVALEGIRRDWNVLEEVASSLKADQSFMIAAVKVDPHSLMYASEELRENAGVVRAAMRRDYRVFQYASEALKENREFRLAAVKRDHRVLGLLGNHVFKDNAFIVEAIQSNWRVVMLDELSCTENRDFVLAAVGKDWQAFKYVQASTHTRDPEIIMAAARKDPRALGNASTEAFEDRHFVAGLIEQVPGSFAHMPKTIRCDRDVVKKAVHADGLALKWAVPALQDDCELVMAAVTKNWRALEFASPRLRADRSIVRAAVRQSSNALRFADPSLKNWRKVMSDDSAGSENNARIAGWASC